MAPETDPFLPATSLEDAYAASTAVSQLIQQVKIGPNAEWMGRYFDLLQLVLHGTSLPNDDPRLVMSLPKSTSWFLSVSINNRYVLSIRRWRKQLLVAVILGPEFSLLPPIEAIVRHGRFEPLRGEGALDTPFLLYLSDTAVLFESSEWQHRWLDAAKNELHRAVASPYRRYHQPVVYQAATNLAFRQTILQASFG